MTTLEKIVERLKAMPESVQAEVLDFIDYLKSNAPSSLSMANELYLLSVLSG